MRLLQVALNGTLTLTKDITPPGPYAILSHTWRADEEEVTFDDLEHQTGMGKTGYDKLRFCVNQAKIDGLKYCWVDTCCINKASLSELDEAIRSMFQWYYNAARCYVYLSDVPLRNENKEKNREWKLAFRKSRWFTRGWTLQELLAPRSVEFFSQEGDSLGTKTSLEQQIHEITQVPVAALRGTPLSQFSPEERLQWALKRETKRKEDRAYCLFGIFGVFMSLMYGEGDNAFKRLKEEINKNMDLSQLKVVEGASFDSYDEVNEYCHPDTRCGLLKEIQHWIQQPDAPNIFWLNGMAGTGKSTISRTVAKGLATQVNGSAATLGASFFFKRGEGDRGSAALLFPTLAGQLVTRIHGFGEPLAEALSSDPQICSKALGEQFKRLVDGPLRKLPVETWHPTYVVVVDALDECGKENDIRTVLDLWLTWSSIGNVPLKLFLTSRPDVPFRLGFHNMSGQHRTLILHEVPQPVVQQDIFTYLGDAFSKIRDEYNREPLGERLDDNWPGDDNITKLTNMAVPLFIIAATIYRFIQQDDHPREQLDKILHSREGDHKSALTQLYTPILHGITATMRNDNQVEKAYAMFRKIVGSIVNLAEPLSPTALATMLGITLVDVNICLRRLHAVLQISPDSHALVRPLHLSFGEFLMSKPAQTKPFGVDKEATHTALWKQCLRLLNDDVDGLQENLCSLQYPGQSRAEVSADQIAARLPLALRYACRYWVHHLQMSPFTLSDNDEVHVFLQKHFLHWLEALSLLDRLADAIEFVVMLRSKVAHSDISNHVARFLDDARRFVLANRFITELAPLQLYSSAIMFAPRNSVVRTACSQTPEWITQSPRTVADWGLEVQKLEGHTDSVSAVAFSPDGSQLASASGDQTVRVWNASTGVEVQKLVGHTNWVSAVAFSPDGLRLASASDDQTVRVWNASTGVEVQKLKGHTHWVWAVAFSPDGSQLASASRDKTVRVWNASTGVKVQKLEGHTDWVSAVAFSPDGSQLASASRDQTVRVWNASTGVEVQKLEGHTHWVSAVAFSPDSSQLASTSGDKTVRVWNASTGVEVQKLEGHTDWVSAAAFSPDGLQLASTSGDKTVRVWNASTGVEVQKLEGHTDWVSAVAFSPDGLQLASASGDLTVRVWNANMGVEVQKLEGHTSSVRAVAFSPDSSQLASVSDDQTVRLWNASTGVEVQKLEGHTDWVWAVAFSPDGSQLASASRDQTVRVWNASTGVEVQKLEGHTDWVRAVAFSPDSSQLASTSRDQTLRVWNASTGVEVQKLEGHTDWVSAVAFSPDGSQLASASEDQTVRVWDAGTGSNTHKFNLHQVSRLSFAADSKTIITNRGRINLYATHDIRVQSTTQHTLKLVLNDGWIECHNKRVLWLPHEYRSTVTAVISNLIVIGTRLGAVVFLRFDVSCLFSGRGKDELHLVGDGK